MDTRLTVSDSTLDTWNWGGGYLDTGIIILRTICVYNRINNLLVPNRHVDALLPRELIHLATYGNFDRRSTDSLCCRPWYLRSNTVPMALIVLSPVLIAELMIGKRMLQLLPASNSRIMTEQRVADEALDQPF